MVLDLWERIKDWAILFLLLLLSIITLFAKNEPVFRGMRVQALEMTARVEGLFSWVGQYVRALDENTLLQQENIDLSSQVARLREAQFENDRLKNLLALKDSTDYPMIATRIINKDITRQENFFTVDVGSDQGVEIGMSIINAQGILGKVVLVSKHYARVMSYLNTSFSVPAKVHPSEASGLVRWEGERRDQLLMEHVVKTEVIEPGNLVVTSGYSESFPSGFLIGLVDSVGVRPGRSELQIFLHPSALLQDADYAYVVLRQPAPERIALEAEQVQ